MLLLMWKILLMNFYLSTTSELLPMSGLTAAPDTNQSGTDTQTQAYTCIPTDRHTDRLLQCSSSSFLWVVTSTPLPKQATVHHMAWRIQYGTKQEHHKINITNMYPTQPSSVRPSQDQYLHYGCCDPTTETFCCYSPPHYPYWLGYDLIFLSLFVLSMFYGRTSSTTLLTIIHISIVLASMFLPSFLVILIGW